MPDEFSYDVFLRHSAEEEAVVRLLADGVKMWFDGLLFTPGDSIAAKIEEGLECTRVLVLRVSANTLDFDRAKLKPGAFRLRGPLK